MKLTNSSGRLLWVFAALAFVFSMSPAGAAEEAGSVLGIKGDVIARVDGTQRALLKGDSVFVGETLVTGANSYVIVTFIDGAKATMRPESELTIARYSDGGSENGALIDLAKGGLRAITGAIADREPEAYRVKTPVATLGVRGTEYYLRICEQDCADEQRLYVQNMAEQESF